MGVGRTIARGLAPMTRGPEAVGGALRRILEYGIDGLGPLPGAKSAAVKHLTRTGNIDDAIDALVGQHVRLAGAQGFVTNLGGLATTVVALPANITAIAILQVRMVAAIAHLRGYDIDDGRVRTAVVMCLLGSEQIDKAVASQGLPTSPLAVATAPVFDADLDRRVAEQVMTELASRVGGKRVALLVTKRVPVIGGGVGAVVDGYATHQIGSYTRTHLVRRRALT